MTAKANGDGYHWCSQCIGRALAGSDWCRACWQRWFDRVLRGRVFR